jgi:hypothetical protein
LRGQNFGKEDRDCKRDRAKAGIALPPIVKPPPTAEPTSLSREGYVTAREEMNFYTKVLSKFAASKGLSG